MPVHKPGALPWDTTDGVTHLDLAATRFNHAYAIAFSLDTDDETGEQVPASDIRKAILKRLSDLSDAELKDAVGLPHDSYKVGLEGGQ